MAQPVDRQAALPEEAWRWLSDQVNAIAESQLGDGPARQSSDDLVADQLENVLLSANGDRTDVMRWYVEDVEGREALITHLRIAFGTVDRRMSEDADPRLPRVGHAAVPHAVGPGDVPAGMSNAPRLAAQGAADVSNATPRGELATRRPPGDTGVEARSTHVGGGRLA